MAGKYPDRPIRIIVPFAPGGSVDVVARVVGQKLTEAWGQQVIVETRPGAGTMIGTAAAAKAGALSMLSIYVDTDRLST